MKKFMFIMGLISLCAIAFNSNAKTKSLKIANVHATLSHHPWGQLDLSQQGVKVLGFIGAAYVTDQYSNVQYCEFYAYDSSPSELEGAEINSSFWVCSGSVTIVSSTTYVDALIEASPAPYGPGTFTYLGPLF